jgi:hypothetical protein
MAVFSRRVFGTRALVATAGLVIPTAVAAALFWVQARHRLPRCCWPAVLVAPRRRHREKMIAATTKRIIIVDGNKLVPMSTIKRIKSFQNRR